MKQGSYYLLLLICLQFPNWLNAQLKNFKHITEFNEYQPKTFNKVILDNNGLLWIATDIGLFKYDSRNFYRFSSEKGLPDNEVLDIHVDIDNNVWVSTFSNQIAFIRNDTAYSQANQPSMKWPTFENNKSFTRLSPSAYGGVYASSYYDGTFFHVTPTTSIKYKTPSNEGIVDLIECGSKDSLMVYTKTKRILFVKGRITNVQLIDYNDAPFLKPFYINGELLEFKYQHNKNCVSKIMLHNDCQEQLINQIQLGSALNIVQKTKDTIFLFVSNKIFYYDHAKQNFQLDDSLPENVKINSMVFDLMQNKIIETKNDGLYFYSKSSSKNYANVDEAYNGNIKLIERIGDEFFLWINKTLYVTKSILSKPTPLYTSENEVKSIFKIDKQNIIIFLSQDTYLKYNHQSIKKIKAGSYYAAVKQVSRINDSIVCIAASSATYLFNINKNKTDTTLYPFRSTSVASNSKEILIGTLSGLYKYDISTKEIEKIKPLDQIKISCITADSLHHRFIIGTTSSGIYMYKDGQPIQHVTTKNKLISNEIVSIKVRNNYLILNSNKGVQYFSIQNDTANSLQLIKTINKDEGLNTNNINDIEINDQSFLIGLNDGLVSMYIGTNKPVFKIPLQIPSIEVNGHIYSNTNKPIYLNPTENYVKIHYHSLGYMVTTHLYKYRLRGIDLEWQFSENDYKEYGPLPPGSYEFELMAVDREGVQQSDLKRLNFIIKPRFYQIRSVQILSVICFLAALSFFAFRWNKNNRKKDESKRQLLELELQAIRSQINPHFIFNSLASIQSFINNNKIIESNLFISKFAKLIRSTLELSKASSITLADELEYIQNYLYLQQIRFHDKFNYLIHIEDDVQPKEINIPPLITQLYIENAIVHGLRGRTDQGLLEIKIYIQDKQLFICIDDNGIGRIEANKRKDLYKESRGLTINKERIDKYNSLYSTNICIEILDKYDTFKNPKGTTVKIILPYVESRNH